MSGSNTPSREDGALSGGDQTPRASGDSSAAMGGYGQQRPLPLAERDGADQPMWSLALTNLDPSLSDQELTDFFKAQPGGSDVFAAQVIRESLDRSTGFVHYLSSSSYASALDDCHEVEIKGRLAKSFPADDKRKLYCRNLPKGLSERDLRGEIESLGGSKCENLSLSNKGDFCFITYVNLLQAERALKRLNQSSIDGNQLHVEFAKSRDSSRGSVSTFDGALTQNTSLHVRNISRNTTEQSLEDHFSVVGKVRGVRVPKSRDDGANTGFAFVDFETHDDAARAITQLSHTTLDNSVIEVCFSKSKSHTSGGRRDDSSARGGDRRGGGYDDRYGRGGAPAGMMGYPGMPYMYPPGAMGGRGGFPAAAYAAYAPYMYPGMAAAMGGMGGAAPMARVARVMTMPMAPAGGAAGVGAGPGVGGSTTAFPSAYGAMGAGGYPMGAYDPRYAAMYASMMGQAMPGAAGMGAPMGAMGGNGASSKKDSNKRRSSRSRSPKRRDRSTSPSRSRSRSRSRDRKRR